MNVFEMDFKDKWKLEINCKCNTTEKKFESVTFNKCSLLKGKLKYIIPELVYRINN